VISTNFEYRGLREVAVEEWRASDFVIGNGRG
jgi:hypothetical protein